MGVFQPADEGLWNAENDFSLWRCIVRELAEELRGGAEDYETGSGPIDYTAWTFADRLTRALDTGQAHAFCLGIGVDPLTFATDILTVLTIDSPLHDELFGPGHRHQHRRINPSRHTVHRGGRGPVRQQ